MHWFTPKSATMASGTEPRGLGSFLSVSHMAAGASRLLKPTSRELIGR